MRLAAIGDPAAPARSHQCSTGRTGFSQQCSAWASRCSRETALRDTLQTLQVTTSRSIVVVTSSDTVNLETALSPRALRPDRRVVLRLFDADLAARVERTFGDTAGAGRVIIGG